MHIVTGKESLLKNQEELSIYSIDFHRIGMYGIRVVKNTKYGWNRTLFYYSLNMDNFCFYI